MDHPRRSPPPPWPWIYTSVSLAGLLRSLTGGRASDRSLTLVFHRPLIALVSQSLTSLSFYYQPSLANWQAWCPRAHQSTGPWLSYAPTWHLLGRHTFPHHCTMDQTDLDDRRWITLAAHRGPLRPVLVVSEGCSVWVVSEGWAVYSTFIVLYGLIIIVTRWLLI